VRVRWIAVGLVAMVGVLGACSGGSSSSSSSTSTTAATAKPLTILVTNDDGFAADGIDAVVEALRKIPNTKITVVAPTANQSGTDGRTLPVLPAASAQKTKSGYPATAVEGYPVDAVKYALAKVYKTPPDVVVSGINLGQNIGPSAAVSGTVGAAKAAVAKGIPALAASQGLGNPLDYPSAAALVVDWVTARRAKLVAGSAEKVVVSLNVPTCPSGSVRGVKQVPLSSSDAAITPPPDCNSTATQFTDDAAAFLAGFATVTEINEAGKTVTTSTTWPVSG
jgi:5'-nucleotidase